MRALFENHDGVCQAHDKNPVKFWFIKNWLSPSFKESSRTWPRSTTLSLSLRSYKWPTWLNKQTEKQRIIWAYKILFLDVLFPLELNKVHIRRRRSNRSRRYERVVDDGSPRSRARTRPRDRQQQGDGGFQILEARILEESPSRTSVSHQRCSLVDLDRFRALARGDQLRVMYVVVSRPTKRFPASRLGQDLPQRMRFPSFASSALVVVRVVVRERDQICGENDRSLQQSADQGTEISRRRRSRRARRGATR